MNQPQPTIPSEPAGDSWQTKKVFDHAKHDLQSRLLEVKEAATRTANEVQATAATTAAVAREGYEAIREDAITHCNSYRRELACHIREQPLKSVGLAALGGLILGLLARRSS